MSSPSAMMIQHSSIRSRAQWSIRIVRARIEETLEMIRDRLTASGYSAAGRGDGSCLKAGGAPVSFPPGLAEAATTLFSGAMSGLAVRSSSRSS